ncbi:MAG: hypothetical protein HY717_12645 [Planctomycetes bacterium]|nr:hypothetical protein [Planctomycetota bacterium]
MIPTLSPPRDLVDEGQHFAAAGRAWYDAAGDGFGQGGRHPPPAAACSSGVGRLFVGEAPYCRARRPRAAGGGRGAARW